MNIHFKNIDCVKNRDLGDIDALAASIKQHGLLQLILLRPKDDDNFRIVDGRRRFYALYLLNKKELTPEQYRLQDFSDEEEQQAAFVVNTERKQLSIAEEIQQLAELEKKYSIEDLAKVIGRTPAYVARRLKLSTLSSKWQKVLADPEQYPQWTIGKLELIAREPAANQDLLAFRINDALTIEEINHRFAEMRMDLSLAVFNAKDCLSCARTTAASELLFTDLAKNNCCLDKKCFIKKTLTAIQTILKNENLIPLRGSNNSWDAPDYKFAEKIKAQSYYSFQKVRFAKPTEKANAIYVCGSEIGRYAVVTEYPKNATPALGKTDAPAQKKERTVKDMEEELFRKRNKAALIALMNFLKDKNKWNFDEFLNRFQDKKSAITWNEVTRVFFVSLMQYGYHGEYTNYFRFKINKAMLDAEYLREDMFRKCLEWTFVKVAELLRAEVGYTLDDISQTAGPNICKLFHLDWKNDFWKPAEEEIPASKTLIAARLKEKNQK
ncbi:MAG: ParB/RepB/Spo0J family partition protein [Lentisphaerae bacterium]|nr:ParB/RepB/Spo0J family partition protein [Lentisphaerota bacterium]